jgi:hypothetical protein
MAPATVGDLFAARAAAVSIWVPGPLNSSVYLLKHHLKMAVSLKRQTG